MNKKFFSYGLFKEGVRQTRIMGLVGLITIGVITLLIWLGIFSSEFNDFVTNSTNSTMFGMEVAAVLILQYCVFCPLMVLYLFRFLNRRDASDVYHTLPHTRECLHISYFSTVMFWNVVTTLTILLLVLVLYGFTPGMVLNVSQLFSFGLNIFSAQFTVGAGVLFAMSITGTTFANIIVSLLVIFMPRVILTALSGMMETACVIVDIGKQYPFFNPALNVASGIPITLLQVFSNGKGLLNCLTSLTSGIYTIAVGCIILGFAFWVLHHRKSEIAGKASPNRLLQGVYRVALGVVLGLLPVYVIFNAIMEGDINNFSYWVVIFALGFFVALFYFLYELITTKKAKNMVKAIPGFFLVVVISGVFLAVTLGLSNSLLSYIPNAGEIDAVYVLQSDENNYFAAKSEEIALEDEPTKNLVINALQETVPMVKWDLIHRDRNTLYGQYSAEKYRSIQVCIDGDQGKQYRYLLIPHEHYQFLIDVLGESEEYKKSFYEIPTYDTHAMVSSVALFGFDVTEKQNQALYETMVEEIQHMPFEQWYPIATTIHKNVNMAAFRITAQVEENGEDYVMYYPITKTFFPKTFDLLLEYSNQAMPNGIETFRAALDAVAAEKELHEQYDVSATVWHPIEKYMYAENWLDAVQEVVDHAKPYIPGTDNVVVRMALNKYGDAYDVTTMTNVYFMVEPQYIEPYLQVSQPAVFE